MSLFQKARKLVATAAFLWSVSPALACSEGFFVISCYNLGAPSSCVLASYDGGYSGGYGSDTLDSCIDCHAVYGDIWTYVVYYECHGQAQYAYRSGCCGNYG